MFSSEKFGNWLCKSKGFGVRSAKDANSRLKRTKNFIDYEKYKEANLAIHALEANNEYKNLSVFVQSQLKRALTLYFQYSGLH